MNAKGCAEMLAWMNRIIGLGANGFGITDRHMPQPPDGRDLFLVEFPKSGMTWLCTILANIACGGREGAVTFFNVQQHVPDLWQSTAAGPVPWPTPTGWRVFKSHDSFNPGYRHAVVLVRHPVDVMVSFYAYLEKRVPGTFSSLDELIRSPTHGARAWAAHTSSWLNAAGSGFRVCFLRYEDLKADPESTICRLLAVIGWRVDRELLRHSIELSDLERMRAGERAYAEMSPAYRVAAVREGAVGGGQRSLSSEQRAAVVAACGECVEKLYPQSAE